MPDFLDPVVLPANAASALHAVTKQQMDVADAGPDALAVGEETFPRSWAASNILPSTSGSLRLTFFTARKTETTVSVRVCSGGTAAAATPTLCRIGLWTVDSSDNSVSLVASTANDTALFAGTNTAYTKSWSSSYAKVAGQRYALGVLVVTGAASPTYPGLVMGGGLAAESAIAPRITGTLTGQTDLPSSFTSAGLTTSVNRYYAALLA